MPVRIRFGGCLVLAVTALAIASSTFIGYQKTDVSDPIDWGMIEISTDPVDIVNTGDLLVMPSQSACER
jgi:hypothetical protein